MTNPRQPSTSAATQGPVFDALLESDDSVLSTVVNILERGWTPTVEADLERYRASKEEQIKQLCNIYYEEFSNDTSEVIKLKKHTENIRQKIVSLNESVQSNGTKLRVTQQELLDLAQTKSRLTQTSEQVACSLNAVTLIKQANAQIKSKSFIPALRSLKSLRALFAENDLQLRGTTTTHLSTKPANDKTLADPQPTIPSFVQTIQDLVPKIEAHIEKQVKGELTKWFLVARQRAAVVGKSVLQRAAQELKEQQDLLAAKPTPREDPHAAAADKSPRSRKKSLSRKASSILGSAAAFAQRPPELTEIVGPLSKDVFDFGAVYQYIFVYEFLGLGHQGMSYYKENRVAQADIQTIIPSDLSDCDAAAFAAQWRTLLEQVVGFFMLEGELGTSVNLIKRSELQKLWVGTCRKVGEVILKQLANPATWEEDPTHLHQVLDNIFLVCHLFSVSSSKHRYGIDHVPVLDICKDNQRAFQYCLARASETYIQNLCDRFSHMTFSCSPDTADQEGPVDQETENELLVIAQEIHKIDLGRAARNGETPPRSAHDVDANTDYTFSRSVPLVLHYVDSLSKCCVAFARNIGIPFTLDRDAVSEAHQLNTDPQTYIQVSAFDAARFCLSVCWKKLEGELQQNADLSIEGCCQISKNALSYMDGSTLLVQRFKDLAMEALDDDEHVAVKSVAAMRKEEFDHLEGICELFDSVASKAQNRIINQVRANIDELLSSRCLVNWKPNDPPKADEMHGFIADVIAYLKVTFSPTRAIMKSLPLAVQEALHFISCKHISEALVGVLTGDDVKELNAYSLEMIHSDIQNLESFADKCTIDGLRESFDQLRQIVQLLVGGRLDFAVDMVTRRQLYPLVTTDHLLSVLDKYRDVSSGGLFGHNSKRHSKFPKRKAVEGVIRDLQRMHETDEQ